MFMTAKTPRQLDRAVRKLIKQGIQSVQVSREPFAGDVRVVESTLIDIKKLEGLL